MNTPFSPKTRLFRVAHCKEFAPFRKYLISPRKIRSLMQAYRISNLSWFYPLNAASAAEALNEMRARRARGETFYYDLGDTVGLYAFLIGENRPYVLVLPGGGYGDVCSFVEGFPTAVRFNRLGFNAIVGQYRVGKAAHYPHPQEDVAKMVRFIASHAEAWQLASDGYAVCGFSAGGHLAASWGVRSLGWEKYGLPKPRALFLGYSVITMGERTHEGSRKNFLGRDRAESRLQERYSIERQVSADYPPTFLWQCKGDTVVPFDNAVMMEEALTRNNVAHVFFPVDGTAHGWGVAAGTPAEPWTERATKFYAECC